MTYVAEPYALFVDDLLTAFTGGSVRQVFRFLPENEPFELSAPAEVLAKTVRVHGIAGGAHRVFQRTRDFEVDKTRIVWLTGPGGARRETAVWPDLGTRFYANFEHRGLFQSTPRLTDRNPGSVTRLLAESMGREHAVLSGQLEAVYRAAFLETAEGRDLDQVAALVGVARRGASAATGLVVFARATPAPGDIFIAAGVRLSTTDTPEVIFEVADARTLRRGELSVDVPVTALVDGPVGIVPEGAIGLLHRPILGIDTLTNPQPTALSGARESDVDLRARASRALESAGKATQGAIVGALTRVAGVREKDVRVGEDPIARPGIIEVDVAIGRELDELQRAETIARVADLLDESRPAGIRVLANLDAPLPAGATAPTGNPRASEAGDPVTMAGGEDLFVDVDVSATLIPSRLDLAADQRATLRAAGEAAINAFIAEAGLGEALIFNRLVARLMALEAVLDVSLEMSLAGNTTDGRQKNILPSKPGARPQAGTIAVQVRASLIVIDVSIAVTLKGVALLDQPDSARESARAAVEAELRAGVPTLAVPELTEAALRSRLSITDTYEVRELHYMVTYQDAGVRVQSQDVTLPLGGLEQLWVRGVSLLDGEGV